MLQRKKIANKKFTNAGEIIVKVVCLITMKANKNWYWKEHGNKYSVIIATCTIVQSCLDVVSITDVVYLPQCLCNKQQTQRAVRGHLIFIRDTEQMPSNSSLYLLFIT